MPDLDPKFWDIQHGLGLGLYKTVRGKDGKWYVVSDSGQPAGGPFEDEAGAQSAAGEFNSGGVRPGYVSPTPNYDPQTDTWATPDDPNKTPWKTPTGQVMHAAPPPPTQSPEDQELAGLSPEDRAMRQEAMDLLNGKYVPNVEDLYGPEAARTRREASQYEAAQAAQLASRGLGASGYMSKMQRETGQQEAQGLTTARQQALDEVERKKQADIQQGYGMLGNLADRQQRKRILEGWKAQNKDWANSTDVNKTGLDKAADWVMGG